MLLGLPLDMEIPRTNASAVPQFLMDVYNCWTNLGANNADRASCLPISDRAAKNLEDINVVRGVKGTALSTSSEGVFSHSPHRLPASITYHFNVSKRRVKEDVRYAYVRIPKQALPQKTIERVKEQCSGPFSLQLLMRVHSNETDTTPRNVFTLLSSAQLTLDGIGQSIQVEFSNITHQFTQWQKEDMAPTRWDVVEVRLIIGGSDSCYNTLTPEDLGFRLDTNAHIVVFAKSDDSEEALIKAGLAELAAEATASRQRRNAEDSGSMQGSDTADQTVSGRPNLTHLTNHTEFNASTYHLRSCRRYSHTISFAELGWGDYIFLPETYEANFCAGSCEYPLTTNHNTTKHSYIQSLAAKLNPDLVPPPCCTPHTLSSVNVIYATESENFVAHEWHEMRAEVCGCK